MPQRLLPQKLFGQQSALPQKPGQKAVAPARAENQLIRLLRDIRSELKKVVWPSREAVIQLTILVVVVSAAVGMILGVVDFAFKALFEMLIGTI